MSQFQQNVEVVQTERITSSIVRLTLHTPAIAHAARPGQFVMVQTFLGKDPLLRRPFSIHQVNRDKGLLQILFKVVGRGTELLARVAVGEQISLVGPLGTGFETTSPDMSCLVGGGMGIAPMLFLASSLLAGMHPAKASGMPRVILGARNRAELEPFVHDFQMLGLEVLAATDDGSFGHHGLVTEVLKKINLSPFCAVYCCGPRPMMAAVAHWCRNDHRPCQVSVETVMACGMGACLGCAVPLKAGGYAHVCTDGPVFEAEKLLWSL